MAEGDVFYARSPIILDAYAAEDTELQTILSGLFPSSLYGNPEMHILDITGRNGRRKSVIIVPAKDEE